MRTPARCAVVYTCTIDCFRLSSAINAPVSKVSPLITAVRACVGRALVAALARRRRPL
jgi:hypothetical protein